MDGTIDPEDLRAAFLRDGYVLLRALADIDRLRAVQRVIAALISLRDGGSAAGAVPGIEDLDGRLLALHARSGTHKSFIYDTLPFLPEVMELSSSAAVLAAVKACLGLDADALLASINTNLRIDLPGVDWEHRLPWHQDYPYRNKLYARGASAVMWMPVFDCPVALGPVEVIPGSHCVGEITDVEIPRTVGAPHWTISAEARAQLQADPVQTGMAAGDVLIFDILTVHRSGTNMLPGRIRWTTQTRYSSPAAPTYLPQYRQAAGAEA